MKREYLPYMDAFRGVAIILVILTHLRSSVLPDWYYYLVQNATVFFVFISGFLFSYLFNENELARDFWLKKARRLVLPYIISALPGIVYVMIIQIRGFDAEYLVQTLVTGYGHMNEAHWYVPFIVLVFALYPVLRLLYNNRKVLYVVTSLTLVISLFTFRSDQDANPFISLMHFGSVFLAGMVVSCKHTELESFGLRHFWLVVAGSLAAFAATLPFVHLNYFLSEEEVWGNHLVAIDLTFLGKLLLIPGVLVVLKRLSDAGFKMKVLGFLAKISFGLFFWHCYVIAVFNELVPYFEPEQPVLALAVFLGQFAFIILLIGGMLVLVHKLVGKKSVLFTGY